jgi:hypothetical protein
VGKESRTPHADCAALYPRQEVFRPAVYRKPPQPLAEGCWLLSDTAFVPWAAPNPGSLAGLTVAVFQIYQHPLPCICGSGCYQHTNTLCGRGRSRRESGMGRAAGRRLWAATGGCLNTKKKKRELRPDEMLHWSCILVFLAFSCWFHPTCHGLMEEEIRTGDSSVVSCSARFPCQCNLFFPHFPRPRAVKF